MITKQIKLFKDFNLLNSDEEKWKFVLENKDNGITIDLDNDFTEGVFDQDVDCEYPLKFKNYIGNSQGVRDLLAALRVKCQGV